MYTEADWMDSFDEENDDPPENLIWSEQYCLLCTLQKNGRYYVINGAWEGLRHGDDFEVLWNEEGHPENRHLTVTDWVEITREDFDKKYPNFGY